MVEFSLVLPLLLLLIFGIVDFGRFIQTNTSVAEAARQGARQAAAASTDTQAFTTPPSGQCSGVAFTSGANGTGCLSDQAILATVKSALAGVTTSVTLRQDTGPTACLALAQPALGTANLCISPIDSGTTINSTTPCAGGAATAITRSSEWTNHTDRGCYYIQVTVVYAYRPWTPLINSVLGTRTISSSTSVLAEY
jgi:hypothetical protein